MATIRARISDELEKQIQEKIEKLKENAVGGMEINISTVIRYSLEKYLQEQEEIEKNIKTLKIDLESINDTEKLKKLQNAMEQLTEVFSVGYKAEIDLGINLFELTEAINYKLFKLNN